MKHKSWEKWLERHGYILAEHGNYVGKGFLVIPYDSALKVYIDATYSDGWVMSTSSGWPNRHSDPNMILDGLSDWKMKKILLGGEPAYRNAITEQILDGLT